MIYGFLFSPESLYASVSNAVLSLQPSGRPQRALVVGDDVLGFVDNLFCVRVRRFAPFSVLLRRLKWQNASSGYISVIFFFPVSCLHIVLVVVSCIAASNSSDNHLEGPANDSNFIKIISSSLHRD